MRRVEIFAVCCLIIGRFCPKPPSGSGQDLRKTVIINGAPEIGMIVAGIQESYRQDWEHRMADQIVSMKLNQQQLELIERTVAGGAASDRDALIRRALREYAARHVGSQGAETGNA